jgi:PAS domain-containing protein
VFIIRSSLSDITVPSETIKRSELLHFSHVAAREDVLVLAPSARAQLVEDALATLYRLSNKAERDDLLSLIQSIMKHDPSVSDLFKQTAYTICNRRLIITHVNEVFLKRSDVKRDEIIGKSLYFEREYEGTEIEQLYSMVMETRLLADALVRYVGLGYDGWFVLVVVPLEDGGIGVLSRFAKDKMDIASAIDHEAPGAPRYIVLNS